MNKAKESWSILMSKALYDYSYFHGEGSNYPQQGYESLEKIVRDYVRTVADFVLSIKHTNRLKWLDVGCACGFSTHEIHSVGFMAYGSDISDYAICEGKKLFPDIGANLCVCDCIDLPKIFGNEVFDIVSLFQVVEHLPNPEESLRQLARVLKPGGLIIVTTPKPSVSADNDVTHINVHHIKYWKQLFENLGFKFVYPTLLRDTRLRGNVLVRMLTKNMLIRDMYRRLKPRIAAEASYYSFYATKDYPF
jgi:2-polyprenyl-3-methyl-5-hydroxy-6-metoxy-1,4-benzoquinol methylase